VTDSEKETDLAKERGSATDSEKEKGSEKEKAWPTNRLHCRHHRRHMQPD